ncbi:NnrS family protein [Pseudorhizobium pelagicum]|uniref:Short-chain dehydrogenase n=1 Tax=Pseudorhizobium pelagicum TaxID=1509405 RepID=A0A922P1X0_9HYPH|nr:NnrS family protein [Pseudorhizobium pelagicum]KEQ03053.1 short-chain dehydrogenase [Pseudorhizobium pelagicum]KEQ09005.1 short-chain dehydrogenase [Pseudorhizobium pelagicum]
MTFDSIRHPRKGGVPRGLSQTAPVLFSYGFRPFFLAAAIWAVVAMLLWLLSLGGAIAVATDYGPAYWHAHEMLFGYSSAVLAGFLLTAVPNWTGRLPVSGWPLFFLFCIWVAGRLVFLVPGVIGAEAAAVVDSLFLPVLLAICVREVVAGRKWKDLKVIGGLVALSLGNILFHLQVVLGGDPDLAIRLAVSAYVALVTIIGGRIIPSFTRNWINKSGRTDFPASYSQLDTIAISVGISALAAWVLLSAGPVVATLATAAFLLHLMRLTRWRGWTTLSEHLITILHIAYLFVPLGFLGIAFAALGLLSPMAALHVLTVGTIASMMLAVMTRATRGHTGRVLTASRTTTAVYAAIVLAALLRPAADLLPDHAQTLYAASGLAWLAAFGLYLLEYGPMLAMVRRKMV